MYLSTENLNYEVFFMKKIILILAGALLFSASTFAMDLSVGVKGNLGGDASGIDGAALGGGVYVNLDLINGFGVQIEGDITACKITNDDGLVVNEAAVINLPVMAWYNYNFTRFVIGGGAGINASMVSTNTVENSADLKMTFAAGLNAKWFITDNFGLVLGGFGTLDALPSVISTKQEGSTKYNLQKSDFSRNSICGFIGVEYKFDLK